MPKIMLRILEYKDLEVQCEELNWSRNIKYFDDEKHLETWLDGHPEYTKYEVYFLQYTYTII